jgi:molecular chaperone GrpE
MISPPSDNENADIDFEPEDEMGSVGALKAKLQKLRDELAEAKKERSEYLDGWQRAKADMINARKDAAEALKRAAANAKELFVEEIIPALDSFDMAIGSDAWQNVDPAWRKGVESIRTQILGILAANGIAIFGKEGEPFDPTLHEAIQEVEGGTPHTIAKVLRSGYRTASHVLRPAQVSIFS